MLADFETLFALEQLAIHLVLPRVEMLGDTLHAQRQVALEAHLQVAYLSTRRARRVALEVERLFLEQAEHDAIRGQLGDVLEILHRELALRTLEPAPLAV